MATDFVRTLFVTLRRGLAGKPTQAKRVIEALGLRGPHHCVEKPNNESIRGMLAKVSHLVIVETDRMFYLRGMKQHYEQLQRPPWIVHHSPASIEHAQQHQHHLTTTTTTPTSSLPAATTSSRQPRSAWPAPVTPSSMASRHDTPPMAVRPLQSTLLEPHLQEHMAPLPQGAESSYARPDSQPLSQRITPLVRKRGQLINRYGLYSKEVTSVNQQIMALRQMQVDEEEAHRKAVLTALHTPGPHLSKVHASGRGSRRGMLAEAREQAAVKQAQRQERQEQQQQQQLRER